MINELLEILREVDNNKVEIYSIFASIYKTAFDELIKKGFTEDQAIKLISSMHIINKG